jgi:predicted Zn-dependent protease
VRRLVFALASAIVLSATLRAIPLISVADEIELGREAQRQVRGSMPAVTDRAVVEYINSVGRRLAARATGPKYPYTFSIADYRELNAFALPGGPVWVHRGIIDAAANESQLAGVLAHEIAHIAERHAADQLTKQLAANGLLGLLGAVLGNDAGGARTARIGAQVLANGYLLKFTRDDEREADSTGLKLMQRAGWDPRGMPEMMETLRRTQGRDPGSVEVFLSSHPAPAERALALRRMIGDRAAGVRGPSTSSGSSKTPSRDSAAFRAVKKRLRQLPPARRTRRK